MKYSIDNGATWHSAPQGVRVIVEDEHEGGQSGDLHLTMNHEGVTHDVVQDGEIIATYHADYDDIISCTLDC